MELKFYEEKWNWKNTDLFSFLYEDGNIPCYWREFFEREEIKEEIQNISEKLKDEFGQSTIFPEINKVFNAFQVPLEKMKVIILGQDPYHNVGSAMGLCFSIPPNTEINPSLRNIYTELEKEGYEIKKNGDLSHWAKQGCFMINTALTVEKGNPESNLEMWYPFTEKLLKYISENTNGIVWLLMGAKAQDFKKFSNKNNHKLVHSTHPSPFSAYKSSKTSPAFIGSNVFKQVNNFLTEKIEW